MFTSEQLTEGEIYTRHDLREQFNIKDATINTGVFLKRLSALAKAIIYLLQSSMIAFKSATTSSSVIPGRIVTAPKRKWLRYSG